MRWVYKEEALSAGMASMLWPRGRVFVWSFVLLGLPCCGGPTVYWELEWRCRVTKEIAKASFKLSQGSNLQILVGEIYWRATFKEHHSNDSNNVGVGGS